MTYSILLAPPAERQFKSLTESVRKRIVKRLKSLRENPRPQGVKKLAGEEVLYRIREVITGSSIRFKTRSSSSSSSRSATAKKPTAENNPPTHVFPPLASSNHTRHSPAPPASVRPTMP